MAKRSAAFFLGGGTIFFGDSQGNKTLFLNRAILTSSEAEYQLLVIFSSDTQTFTDDSQNLRACLCRLGSTVLTVLFPLTHSPYQ